MASLLVLRATRIARRSARERRRRLVAELGGTSGADRLDLLATLDRYPDSQTQELRDLLTTPRPRGGARAWRAMQPP